LEVVEVCRRIERVEPDVLGSIEEEGIEVGRRTMRLDAWMKPLFEMVWEMRKRKLILHLD
jgi:hypothetical protein